MRRRWIIMVMFGNLDVTGMMERHEETDYGIRLLK
jgi:hypothetical protein